MPARFSPTQLLIKAARALPPSRGVSRAGRLASIAFGFVGIDTVVPVSLEDGTLLVLDTRGRTESEAVWTGRYDRGLLLYLHAAMSVAGANVIDAGANVGLLAIPLAREAASRQGRVLAIEPVADNWRRLQRSAQLNHLDNIDLVTCAIGSAAGEVTLTRESTFGQTSGNAVVDAPGYAASGASSGIVPMRSLDEIVATTSRTWNVLKIDCEGYDVNVLLGSQRLLHDHRPVVWGEFHGGLVPRFGPGFGALSDLLTSARYQVFVFDDVYRLRHVPEVVDGVGNCTLIPDELVEPMQSELRRRDG